MKSSSSRQPSIDPLIGSQVGKYCSVEKLIGRGAMSTVYQGFHSEKKVKVAVKFLKGDLVDDFEAARRFQREARILSRLDFPGIVSVLEFGVHHTGRPFLVMEYVSGTPLEDMIQQQKKVELIKALPIFIQMVDALAWAQSEGILHRDIKPANVIVADDGTIKLIDFGVAATMDGMNESMRLTQHGVVLGSMCYLSPERLQGKPADVRSEVYAMGCVMFEALCGEPPFSGRDSMDLARQHLTTMPRVAIPGATTAGSRIAMIIAKCLLKNPDERYQLFSNLAHDLRVDYALVAGHSGPMPAIKLPSKKSQSLLDIVVSIFKDSFKFLKRK